MSSPTIQPIPVEGDAPVLELVETSYDEVEAAPPPPPAAWRVRAKKIAQICAVVIAVLAYPVAAILSHDLNDRPVVLPVTGWETADLGVAAELINRELEGPGWVDDKPAWHPQSRLTALPAWQDGLASAIGDWVGMRADAVGEDVDLSSAARLLYPLPGNPMTPRLNASLEAMRRFDGRISGGFVAAPQGAELLKGDLKLMAEWAGSSILDIGIVVREVNGLPTDRLAVRTFYIAKARAQVAHQLLSASGYGQDDTLRALTQKAEWANVVDLWARASAMSPLLVANLDGDGFLNPNHLAVMAFYLSEAEHASLELAAALEAGVSVETPDVDSDT